MSLRRQLHDWSLTAFLVLVAYLAWVLLAGRLGLWLAQAMEASTSTVGRLAGGLLVLDLTKLPLLLLAGWLLLRLVRLRPWVLALALLLGSYGLELGLGLMLGQGAWLLAGSAVLLARLAGLFVVGGLLLLALRRWSPVATAASVTPERHA